MSSRFAHIFLILLSAAFMLISLYVSPVWYDDAGHFLVAKQAAEHGVSCYPVSEFECRENSPFITMGPVLTWAGAGWMKLFGTTMTAVRIMMVLLSLLSLGGFMLLGKLILNKQEKVFFASLILLGNIQWITYGSEFLGEVPMLGWVFLGAWALLQGMASGKVLWSFAAAAAWTAAIFTKEYALFFLGFALLLTFFVGLIRGDRASWIPSLITGIAIVFTYSVSSVVRAGGVSETISYFQVRSSYGSEFLAFDFGESLRFLIFKPFILLGTIALVVKAWVKRDRKDWIMLSLQGGLLLFFLASAGYDRFGFQLLPIASLYLAEFIVLMFNRWAKKSKVKQGLVVCFVVIVGWQQTIWRIPSLALDGLPTNAAEIEVSKSLSNNSHRIIFTFDQQIVPFLGPEMQIWLFPLVPSASSDCENVILPPGAIYVQGEYGRTVYPHCIDLSDKKLIQTVSTEGMVYQIWQ